MFEKKAGNGFKKIFTVVFVISVALGAFLYYISINGIKGVSPGDFEQLNVQSEKKQEAAETSILPTQPETAGHSYSTGDSVAQVVAREATPGVVGITVERISAGNLFNWDKDKVQVGVGSGVIVSSDGYILTNNHVAGGESKRIVVSLADGRNVDGMTVWSDPVLDLAVVKINLNGLHALKLGDASILEVGEPAIAIGNPLGLEFQRTVTSGIISALNRTISINTDEGTNFMEDLIQTDAGINPGNSGGPLLNSKGEVVGINTIKVASAEAMGFAIPVNVARPIIDRFKTTGEFTEAYMGVFAYDKAVMPYIDSNVSIDKGIYVAYIDEESPAYKAGIRLGCIIRQIDDMEINSMMQLRTILNSKAPGDIINVTHLMHGTFDWITVPLTLGEKVRDGLVTR